MTRCPGCGSLFGKHGLRVHAHSCKRFLVQSQEEPRPTLPVRCDECPQEFPNARLMGQHKTREHFGMASMLTSTLGGLT